jgi:Dolichyl-phosphate-mannose-protein mannosyltransferase
MTAPPDRGDASSGTVLREASAGPGKQPGADEPVKAAVGVGECAVGATIVLVGLLAWAALALAHAGRFSLGAVVAVAGVAAVLVAVVLVRSAGRPRVVLSWAELAMLLGVALVAAFFFLPGFPYGVGDKDPGLYVAHGMSIARTGSYALDDPVLDRSRIPSVTLASPGARLPGVWIRDLRAHRDVPQFYHLFPAALATAYRAARLRGIINLNPVFGVLAVLATAAVVRRAFGAVAGTVAGLLLATNMPEVWQAKYPTTEIMVQMLLMGSLLALTVALDSGWRPVAGLAGLLLGLSFLARPDMLLLVLLAAGVGCLLVVLGRFDARAAWFAGGLAVTLPHGLLQAYDFARSYTMAAFMPSLGKLTVVVAVLAAGTVVLRRLLRARADDLVGVLERRRTQLLAGLAVLGVATVLLAVGFLRPRLFAPTYWIDVGQRVRTWDELNLRRLSWFLTLPGFALLWVGLAVVALRRWRATAWAVVLPVLLLFPVYGFRALNAARLMFWVRRFVPVVVPGAVILIAVALAYGWATSGHWRLPARLASVGLTVFLLGVFTSQSLPLRHHREFLGSFQVVERIARASGDRQGVFLWEQPKSCCAAPTQLFASPVWLQQGQVSALLPAAPSPAYVATFVRGFPGQPVFVVGQGTTAPRGYGPLTFRLADHIAGGLPVWRESVLSRPAGALVVPFELSIWQVEGSSRPAP